MDNYSLFNLSKSHCMCSEIEECYIAICDQLIGKTNSFLKHICSSKFFANLKQRSCNL